MHAEDIILRGRKILFVFEKRKVDGMSINSNRDNFGFDSLQFRSIDIGRNHSDGIEYGVAVSSCLMIPPGI